MTLEKLKEIKENYLSQIQSIPVHINICAGTGCIANGAMKVFEEFKSQLENSDFDIVLTLEECGGTHEKVSPNGSAKSGTAGEKVHVVGSGCHGFCQMGPLVSVDFSAGSSETNASSSALAPDGQPAAAAKSGNAGEKASVQYVKVKTTDVSHIIKSLRFKADAQGGRAEGSNVSRIERDSSPRLVENLLYKDNFGNKYVSAEEIPFYALQQRTMLEKCGKIDATDIKAYIAEDGYTAAHNAYNNLTPQDITNTILRSGLRGRGGAGFPTGKKWEITALQQNEKKYIVCNADEGDPGAFMDRSILEGNPHSVIEGMLLAAKAIGANEGYIYVRTEYPLACSRIKEAIKQCYDYGILGDNIFETDNSFGINVMEGAGAFVCGEETALIASIEGKRGMPQPKPPFPAVSGLFGKPTCINNVETLSTVPLIMDKGADWFKTIGTAAATGTKTFAVTGNISNTGLVEVPFGTTLRHIIENVGGGVLNDAGQVDMNAFKAAQIGGPSGGCLTAEHLDMPLDYDNLAKIGAMVGSGGLVIMNNATCMVSIAKFFMKFTQGESCGKCVICREGTKQMLALLTDITEGNATMDTLNLLEELALSVREGSLCGLGKTAPNPVLATLKYFRAEYEEHIINKRCPTKQCKALTTPEILPELCKGCRVCQKACPVDAISGDLKKPHTIDASKCIKCGSCRGACKFNAIIGVGA